MSGRVPSHLAAEGAKFRVWILVAALALAAAGTISSTVFLALALLGAVKFHRGARAQEREAAAASSLPPVSILKPVHGLEERLKENIESFFRQDYPAYEILFAAHDEHDPALSLIREVAARYPQVPCRIFVTGPPPWPNRPSFSFSVMADAAAHSIFVTSDSDVEVASNYLREVVPPLGNPSTGMVTCVYRGKNAGGFWSGIDAIGMSVEMTAGVVTANLLEGMRFGLGPTIAVRQDALASIGGYQVLAGYLSNDFIIGNLIEKAGYRVVLSRHVVDHVAPPMTFRLMWERHMRWTEGTRYSRPLGHAGTALIYAMPYGILGFLAAAGLGHMAVGAVLLGAAIANRMIESWAIGWGVVRDPVARRRPWLYPLRDLLGVVEWCASYMSGKIMWRGSRYDLVKGGRLVPRENSPESSRAR